MYRNLHKAYTTPAGSLPVLRGIDLDIYQGDFVAIVGGSGVGKITRPRGNPCCGASPQQNERGSGGRMAQAQCWRGIPVLSTTAQLDHL